MSETSTQNPDTTLAYQSAASILFWLGILSIGGSNLISALTLGTFTIQNLIGVLLIVIYFATSYFTRKGSTIAFLIGATAFALSGIQGLVLSFMNAETMNSLMGENSAMWVIGLNLLYVLVVGALLIQRYRALPNKPFSR